MLRAMLRGFRSAILVVALVLPGVARAAEPSDGRRTLARLPANLARGTVGLFAKDNLVPFVVGGSLTAAAFPFEDDVRSELRGSDLGGLQSFGDKIGDAVVVVPMTAGLFLAGRAVHAPRFRDMTYDLAQAQVATAVLGGALKRAVGRERPNGSNHHSFPSGHSYSWFATATVVERHYGLAVAAPVFALWGITATSRIANDTHYLGDVVAGAALGCLVARTTVRVNAAPEAPRRAEWQVVPSLGRHRQASVRVSVAF